MIDPSITYLVGEQKTRNGVAIGQAHLGVEVVLPLDDCVKGLRGVYVKHKEGANCFFVVDAGHVACWQERLVRKESIGAAL